MTAQERNERCKNQVADISKRIAIYAMRFPLAKHYRVDALHRVWTEPDAWEVKESFDDEGNLACASPELRNWIYGHIDTIV